MSTQKCKKVEAGFYEYRGHNIERNHGTPTGCYAAWLARFNGKSYACDTKRDAIKFIDAKLA